MPLFAKTDGDVRFANSDPRMIALFCAGFRRFFEVDETRLRLRSYLHQGLDLERAAAFWSGFTAIPISQFAEPYRAIPDAGVRNSKHELGRPSVVYSCTHTHRAVMGLVRALLSFEAIPG